MPNKTNALREGVKLIDKSFEYAILLDDDTLFPEDFYLSEDEFEENVGLIAFGLKMKDQDTLIEKCVNLEYLLFCYNSYCKNYGSVEFACGAAYMMRRNVFEHGMDLNPADGSVLPYGEDGLIGVSFQSRDSEFGIPGGGIGLHANGVRIDSEEQNLNAKSPSRTSTTS